MRRKYKIYINERPLYLVDTTMLEDIKEELPPSHLILPYRSRSRSFFNAVDHLNKGAEDAMVLYSNDPKLMYRDFCDIYKKVVACGGLVLNEEGTKVLMIFRRGHWDLPKGKRDKGEGKRACAAREVMEETGINEVTIEAKLMKTRHLYPLASGGRALKISHWYLMHAKETALTPQIEEDIEIAEWVPLSEAQTKSPIYRSIADVLDLYLS